MCIALETYKGSFAKSINVTWSDFSTQFSKNELIRLTTWPSQHKKNNVDSRHWATFHLHTSFGTSHYCVCNNSERSCIPSCNLPGTTSSLGGDVLAYFIRITPAWWRMYGQSDSFCDVISKEIKSFFPDGQWDHWWRLGIRWGREHCLAELQPWQGDEIKGFCWEPHVDHERGGSS